MRKRACGPSVRLLPKKFNELNPDVLAFAFARQTSPDKCQNNESTQLRQFPRQGEKPFIGANRPDQR